ncbi:MAG: shikimate kinase [Desulfobacteraceae bacterium]|nr:shikimate kinase [Desulfobacteraceae bacterium]
MKLTSPPFDTGSNINLIGMPGAGKSTVGVILAKHLGFDFLDTDLLIQNGEGLRLAQIIEKQGIGGFRAVEESYLLTVPRRSMVVATGGSVVYSEKVMRHLKSTGLVVFLDITVKALRRRVGSLDARGVLRAPDQTLDMIFDERHPLYQKYADLVIQASELTPAETMVQVRMALRDKMTGLDLTDR